MRGTSWAALAAGVALAATGCADTGEDDGLEPPAEGPVTYIPSDDPYPTQPYGIDKGEVIENIEFQTGLVNAAADPKAAATKISLADFYNPTGDAVFVEGSPFPAGERKPQVLLVAMAARWCQPCRIEARDTLPEKYAELGPQGAEFLLVLADGAEAGVRATEDDLRKWTEAYPAAYPAVTDEGSDLAQHFLAEQYPANMIIDTKTMRIVQKIIGAPDEESSFWKLVDTMANQ